MKRFFPLLAAVILATPAWADNAFLLLDRHMARALVDPAKHTRPTIIALWSSECPHCKKNLALYARLAKQDKRLRLVTIAAEPAWPGLTESLDRLGISGDRYAYGDDAPDAIAHAIDPAWRGELPRTLFFDGLGSRQTITGAVTARDVKKSLGL